MKTLIATVSLVGIMVSAQAQVTTDPVGFVKTTVLGNSDGLVSVPFSRAPSFMGLVQAWQPTQSRWIHEMLITLRTDHE